MANVSVMRKNFEGTDWKRAFADAVIRLRPDMNPDRADELSDVEYAQAKGVDPSAAALRWFGRGETAVPAAPVTAERASNGE